MKAKIGVIIFIIIVFHNFYYLIKLKKMLPESNNQIFLKLMKESSTEEIIWMSGYICGFLSLQKKKKDKEEKKIIPLVYGTETGNAKNLAFSIYQEARKKNIIFKVISIDQYRLSDLEKEDYLLLIISTHGDGEPPSSAKSFFDFIHKKNDLNISKLKYSVLALGDKSYPFFCKAGEDIDKRLYKIGGTRIVPLFKCDTDYEVESKKWLFNILNFFKKKIIYEKSSLKKNNKNRIKCGNILNNILLSDKERGSNKEVYHIEILANNEVEYLPGDSIGIYPKNHKYEILEIFEFFKKNKLKENEKNNILKILEENVNISNVSENFLEKYFFFSHKKNFSIEKDVFIKKYKNYSIIDLLKKFPIRNTLKELVDIMENIKPRFYSICSSPKVHNNEIHITVSRHYFQSNGRVIYGHCSNFLSKLKKGDKIYFFIHKNHLFKLPSKEKDIILIGPGTGIAPFRSFLYEREFTESTGKNWLFFGDQHFNTDFLYQTEIQDWKKKGVLHYVSLSFSRDQERKIYVQDKIWENRLEFFSWINNGAYVYVCGKRKPMSIDVENMILKVIEKVGKLDPVLFINEMKKNGRYLKDVY
ncbi:diflavin oxidoreductase [Blattabacterium cuenoti]|uniref:diflavin oxidoreductase n=1 Tax=Blattabacterium cuenoti TaxID=1653831 RepID=UPI001EEBEBC5|nr:flavodoxin domain-containing protein [Blattabacterium cuenoti]